MKPEILKSLKDQLSYDQDSGLFYWKVKKRGFGGGVDVGSIAGTPKEGYVKINCDQKQYRAHRLAWIFVHGEFPPSGYEIDHINGVRSDNRLCNLRLVTRSQNNMNMTTSVSNKSGHRGVSFRKDTKRWHARICIENETILLGNFDTKEDAISVRKEAEIKYFKHYSQRS